MKKLIFFIFLLVLAVIESAVSVRLTLAASLILLNFVEITSLIPWIFVIGFILDLLLGNFLGVNSLILIVLLIASNLAKNFIFPNMTYQVFPKQTTILTIIEIVLASRIYGFFYNLVNFGIANFNSDLRIIPAEVISAAILFPIIVYLSLHFGPKKQLELKF